MPTEIYFAGGESVVVGAEIDDVRSKLLADPWVQLETKRGNKTHVRSDQVTHLVERAERGKAHVTDD